MRKCLVVCFCITLAVITGTIPIQLPGQNAPVTTAAGSGNIYPGTQVVVPVTVTGFNNIGSISLALDYDYSKLHFVSGTKNPLLTGSFSIGDINLGTGNHRIIVGWFGPGTSLPNGSYIFNLVFTYLSGNASLQWFDNGPSCAYTDGSANPLNDIPFSTYYINGWICGVIANPGTISGDNSICTGELDVPYSITPLENVTGYNWQVPPGAVVSGGTNTNGITVDYPAGATSGNISVSGINECGSGPVSLLPVTVNLLPVANAGNDTTIAYGTTAQLHAQPGGAGSYTYHWTPENLLVDPNIQNPLTVPLTTTTLFQLELTGQGNQCVNTDEVVVTITGGVLTVSPMAIPGALCHGESAQLYSNAGGGSGNYTYSWTSVPPGTPPWTSNLENPVVIPDTTTLYLVSVSDGFTVATGSATVEVRLLPTAFILGGDTLCDDGTQCAVQIDLTGTAPWSFTYTNGLSTWTIIDQTVTPYIFYTAEPGTYTVLSVEDLFCPGHPSGEATVTVIPVPPDPEITWYENVLYSNAPEGNQWYVDMVPIPGATEPTFTPTLNGEYFTIVTMQGCSSDTSNKLDIVVTGLAEAGGSRLIVFPNPASGSFRLRLSEPVKEPTTLRICSVNGTLEREVVLDPGTLSNEFLVDAGGLPDGIHLLFILINDNFAVQKLILF